MSVVGGLDRAGTVETEAGESPIARGRVKVERVGVRGAAGEAGREKLFLPIPA
jgi:hypothetical protein